MIAVVGAGITGLWVSRLLAEQGLDVHLFEANARMGGQALRWGRWCTGPHLTRTNARLDRILSVLQVHPRYGDSSILSRSLRNQLAQFNRPFGAKPHSELSSLRMLLHPRVQIYRKQSIQKIQSSGKTHVLIDSIGQRHPFQRVIVCAGNDESFRLLGKGAASSTTHFSQSWGVCWRSTKSRKDSVKGETAWLRWSKNELCEVKTSVPIPRGVLSSRTETVDLVWVLSDRKFSERRLQQLEAELMIPLSKGRELFCVQEPENFRAGGSLRTQVTHAGQWKASPHLWVAGAAILTAPVPGHPTITLLNHATAVVDDVIDSL